MAHQKNILKTYYFSTVFERAIFVVFFLVISVSGKTADKIVF